MIINRKRLFRRIHKPYVIIQANNHHPQPIRQRLRQVGRLDVLIAGQVGDGEGEYEFTDVVWVTKKGEVMTSQLRPYSLTGPDTDGPLVAQDDWQQGAFVNPIIFEFHINSPCSFLIQRP